MAIREKLRKKFSRGSSTSASSSSESSSISQEDGCKFEVYKPGEKIPYKYRRPVERAHKEKLDSFCFATAWSTRRKSFSSQYSPMGSKLPSRRCSIEMQMGRRSMNVRRGAVEFTGEDIEDDSPQSESTLEESPFYTPDFASHLSHSPRRMTALRHDTPFDPDDLTLALQKSQLTGPS